MTLGVSLNFSDFKLRIFKLIIVISTSGVTKNIKWDDEYERILRELSLDVSVRVHSGKMSDIE